MSLPLSGCTFGWLHRSPLIDALRELARHEVRTIELTTCPPHLFTPSTGPYERRELARTLRSLDLAVVSVNPSYADINLVSTNPVLREAGERQLTAELELASELGAHCVVAIPGRLHALAPAPLDVARSVLEDALDRLTRRGGELGVVVALENNPYGFLGAAGDLLGVVEHCDNRWLGIAYDSANAPAAEDPAEAVRAVGRHLAIAHVSDTTRERWQHTSPGRGEVDFAAFAQALEQTGFRGPTVYELVDGEDPGPRLERDFGVLEAAGWSRKAAAQPRGGAQ